MNYGSDKSHEITASALEINPNYTGFNNPSVSDDLMIITLDTEILDVPYFLLYPNAVTEGTTFTMVGYGRSGDGVNGYTTGASFTIKREGKNDADKFELDDEGTGSYEVWTADFDYPDGNSTGPAGYGGPTSADFTFTTATAPTEATAVTVDAISYATSGGKFKDKHLSITVALLNNLSDPDPVAGASVTIDLFRDDSFVASGTGTSGTDGTVTFTLSNAPSGFYRTTVTDVTADGLTWNGDTPDNSFDKMSTSMSTGIVVVEPSAAVNAETPADASDAIPVFFVVETTTPTVTDSVNDDVALVRVSHF